MKKLREKVLLRFNEWREAYSAFLLYGKPIPIEQDLNIIDELIIFTRTATLNEVKEAVIEQPYAFLSKREALKLINNLRGASDD